MITNDSIIYIALPVMDELNNISSFLSCIKRQTDSRYKLIVCVNQPDDYWDNDNKLSICKNNQSTLQLLSSDDLSIEVIDRSSKGKGWCKKRYGVGWARKVCMDRANELAQPDDIIICVDADTYYPEDYLSSIRQNFIDHPKMLGLAVPYHHPLCDDEHLNRHILRYEIYMRTYALNMWKINNPYAYTAVGSSMAVTVKTYNKIGGITPHKSGEDFYFLQKIKKAGTLGVWNEYKTQPAARYSDRVFFGTGPALIKGSNGDWSSYPIYHRDLFKQIKKDFSTFTELYDKLPDQLNEDSLLKDVFTDIPSIELLRNNATSKDKFIKACHQKVDGLRILQFLKKYQAQINISDELSLKDFFEYYYPELISQYLPIDFSFDHSPIEQLEKLRLFLETEENKHLKSYHHGI
ncbi:MAG: glycosyltransferase family 2 protein [Hyphomicrobiales bacterium]